MILDPVSNTLVELGLGGVFRYFGARLLGAMTHLREAASGDRAHHVPSVAGFWYESVDKGQVSHGSKIRIAGILSVFVPLCPRHPRSVPGKRVDTWVSLRSEQIAEKKDFATRDFILWNDGVLVAPVTGSRRVLLGLADPYGYVGHGTLPLIADLNDRRQRAVYDELISHHPAGLHATVEGRLVYFSASMATEFGVLAPSLVGTLTTEHPNYALELLSVKTGASHDVVTGTMWMGFRDETIFPVYCYLLDRTAHDSAMVALAAEYGQRAGEVTAVHDVRPFQRIRREMPPLNDYLATILARS